MPKAHEAQRPRDANQLAKPVVDQATQEAPAQVGDTADPKDEKNPAAVALGRLGG